MSRPKSQRPGVSGPREARGAGPPAGHVAVARIGAPHGVRGEVRLFVFTEDAASLRRLGPFVDDTGTRVLRLTALRPQGDHFVARLDGIDSRDAAEAVRNVTLHVPRDRLPAIAEDDTFYITDLVGLRVESPSGDVLGKVVAVQNFGAGDILDIAPQSGGGTVMVAFTREMVPQVDIAGGRVVIADAALLAPPVADQGPS